MSSNRQLSHVGAILVFHGERAILTDVIVKRVPDSAERLIVCGEVSLANSALEHINSVVLPLVDSILSDLHISPMCYQISIAQFSAASVTEQTATVSGHSLDISLFLGLLSASLGLRVPRDITFTGHIAEDGRILMVSSLPEKLQCAVSASPQLTRFCIPELLSESSLKALRPQLRETLHCAIAQAKQLIRIEQVGHINQLASLVFAESTVLHAALKANRFTTVSYEDVALEHLSGNLPKRFFMYLRQLWMELDEIEPTRLIQAYCEHHRRVERYPSHLGKTLSSLILALPPQVKRHLRSHFPMSKAMRLSLAKLARDEDAEDVEQLFTLETHLGVAQEPAPQADVTSSLLERLLAQLSERTISQQVTAPILEARVQFHLDSTKVKDSAEFYDTIRAFYIHVQQQTGDVILDAQNPFLKSKSVSLLKRTYTHKNGLRHALVEATSPLNGGMSLVLDKMTQTLCNEGQNDYITHALETVIDALDDIEELQLAEAFLNKLRPELPEDLQDLCAEELTGDWHGLIIRYIQTRGQFHQLLRNS